MPRHFLVKRHKQCGATLSYRDRPHGDQGNIISSNDSYITASTTIIDTDKNIIIRDGDHHSDYSGYSSPDSGYAASPNGAHANCTREKENVGGDRENNNNMNCTKVNNAIGFYDQANVIMNRHQYSSINNNHYYSSNGIHPDVVDESDVPMDLSMPSRKKEVLSSVPAYLQQENHRHHHHHQQQQHAAAQQQQPTKYLFHHPLSPNNISSTPSSHAAAVVYLNTFTNFYLQDKQDKSLCTTMVQPLSPAHPVYNPLLPLPGPDSHTESRYANTLTADVVAMDTTGPAAQAELFSRAPCLSVPATSNGQISSLSSSSFSSLSSKSLINVSSRDSSTTEDRVTPLKTPSPLHSPSRKRAISEEQEEPINTCLPQNLSKSAPVLKKCDVAHSAVTPTSKGTTATAQQRGKTTVPAVKKSQSATPSGKKLKAVRRLNFDIDTTSPVSGTIIKDAADFHPEEGKIVYGDIEPSFNFVEVTPEARAELEKIENKIGDYICQLCKEFYEDAFQLAQHRCSRIVHVEYRCPECEKVFNCPANLASHRRWHKPRAGASGKAAGSGLSKLLPATQKIVPKPDCNGNNVTDAFPATKGSNASSASAVTIVSLPSNVSNPSKSLAKYADDISSSSVQPGADFTGANKDFSTVTKSMIHQSDKINNANIAFREDSEPGVSHSKPVSNTDDKLPAVSVNASRISNGGIYQDPVLSQRSKSVSPSSDSSFPPSTYQESHLRPGSVIATNPLHTTTFGSTLTPEEKSLVLQVLNSHQRHHQTTTITCTTTVMTPLVSDSHSSILNSDPMNTSCNDIPKPSEGGDLTRPGLVEDRVTVMDTSSSSPPLDLTQTSEASYQREQFDQRQYEGRLSTEPQPQQQQQQHHPMAAVPERQGNPQIQCLLCGKRFQRQAYLRKHMQSQHGKHKTVLKPTDVIACKDLNTPDGNGILSGATTTTTTFSTDHHGGFTTTMSCGVCGKCFNSESARLKHEATTHGLPPTLTCSTCAMTFTSKAALDKHTRANHAAESFPCKYCSSSFHSSPGLTRHINKCHPTENRQVILLQLPASRTC